MNAWSAGESSRTPTISTSTIAANVLVAEEPISRSRTNFFLSIRSSSIRPSRTATRRYNYVDDSDSYGQSTPDEENQRLLSGADHPASAGLSSPHAPASPMNSAPPVWIDLSNQVQDILSRTRSKIAVLDKLHAKHALPGFSDRSAEEREIESMTTDITRDFRKCQGLIQQITPHASPSSVSFPPSGPSRHQVLTAQNVQRGLAAKVQDLSGAFRKKQRVYMQKLQGHAIKNQDLLIASGAVSLKGSDGVKALEEDVEASRSQLKTQQQSQEQLIAPDITQRTHEISEIARSIASLAEVFKDLSTLVIDQGTILDSVEYNIEQTAVHVQEAAKELQVATRYQKNTSRRKCIFLLLLIIFGLILVLIFKPRRRSAPVSSSPVAGGMAPEAAVDSSTRFRRDLSGRMFGDIWS